MANKYSIDSSITMVDGHKMPRLGFGIYESPVEVCMASCKHALKTGYRHIDSAQYYQNETQAQEAVQASGIPRDQVFLTTKMLSPSGDVDGTYKSIEQSVKKLGGTSGYVDLFLIHSPHSGSQGRKTMWQALERAQKAGIVKSIGVSNFGIAHIEEMRSYAANFPPAVNQIELHPWSQQRDVVTYCHENNVVVQAYCPLVRGQKSKDTELTKIANKHNTSTGQVLIRYALQKNWVPLPKSDTPSRIESNADLYKFDLDQDDMNTIDGFDQGPKGSIVEVVDNKSLD